MGHSTCKFDIFPVSHIHIIHVLRQPMLVKSPIDLENAVCKDVCSV